LTLSAPAIVVEPVLSISKSVEVDQLPVEEEIKKRMEEVAVEVGLVKMERIPAGVEVPIPTVPLLVSVVVAKPPKAPVAPEWTWAKRLVPLAFVKLEKLKVPTERVPETFKLPRTVEEPFTYSEEVVALPKKELPETLRLPPMVVEPRTKSEVVVAFPKKVLPAVSVPPMVVEPVLSISKSVLVDQLPVEELMRNKTDEVAVLVGEVKILRMPAGVVVPIPTKPALVKVVEAAPPIVSWLPLKTLLKNVVLVPLVNVRLPLSESAAAARVPETLRLPRMVEEPAT
jgi:hypothetical protein